MFPGWLCREHDHGCSDRGQITTHYPNVSHIPGVRSFRTASVPARNPINSRGAFCRHLIYAGARRHRLDKEGPLKRAAPFPDVAGWEARAPKRPHTWVAGTCVLQPWEGRARTLWSTRPLRAKALRNTASPGLARSSAPTPGTPTK
jgi:hypothetical protein